MKVLVVDRRAAGHALAWKAAQDPDVEQVYLTRDQEDGSREVAENVPISTTDISALRKFASQNVDYTVVGHEAPQDAGIGDAFAEDNLPIFAPSRAATQLETSKAFSKKLMTEKGIPTADFNAYNDYEYAVRNLYSRQLPVMIKASGPAQARGTQPCFSYEEAEAYLTELMVEGKAGEAGRTVVIEDFLTGPEVSLHAWCDGNTYQMFPASQDHKYLYDNDKGPLTGSVGAVGPLPGVSPLSEERLGRRFVEPMLQALGEKGLKYAGVLYPGLMITPTGPKVLEYNVRYGGPEAEVYMRLLASSLIKMSTACTDGRLDQEKAIWRNQYSACVVMTSGGYPGDYPIDYPIDGLEDAKQVAGVEIFHGGTRYSRGRYLTNGGRVLSVTAMADTLEQAIQRAYTAVGKIDFEGKYYRTDIGRKALSLGRLILV